MKLVISFSVLLFTTFILIGQPANNNCSGATTISISEGEGFAVGDFTSATLELATCTGSGDREVWYKFVATATTMTVVANSTDDIVVQLYSGSCGALTSIVCQDNSFGSGNEDYTYTSFTVSSTYYIRVLPYSGSPSSMSFNLAVVEDGHTWVGFESTSWSNIDNWANQDVPDVAENVVIASGAPYDPIISTQTGYAQDLTINTGAVLNDTRNGPAFYVDGNFVNNGTYNHTGTTYIYFRGASKTISGTGNFFGGSICPFYIDDGASYTLGSLTSNTIRITHLTISYTDASNYGTFSLGANTLNTCFMVQDGYLNLNSGTLGIAGPTSYYMSSGTYSTITWANSGGTNPEITASRLDPGTGTVYYNSGDYTDSDIFFTNNQTVKAETYYNLKIRNNNTYTVTQEAVTVSGNYEVTNPGTSGGTVSMTGAMDLAGNLTIGSGCDLSQGSNNINIEGNWTNSGTFTEGSGTVIFDGSGTSTVTANITTSYGQQTVELSSEDFENGGSAPTGWATADVVDPGGTNATVTFVTSSSYPTGFSDPTGGGNTYFARFNSYSCEDGDQVRLYQTSSFSSSGYTDLEVSFAFTNDNQYNYTEGVTVQYSTNGSTWTSVGSFINRYSAAGDSWTTQTVTLPSGAEGQATLYIGFLFESGYGNDCYLDDFSITGVSAGTSFTGENFNNFTINKSGAGSVSLSNNIAISGAVTLTDGVIDIGAKDLILPDGIEFSSGSSTSFVVTSGAGSLICEDMATADGTVLFPIGPTSSYYMPVTLTNAGTQDDFSVRIMSNTYENGTSGTTYSQGTVPYTWMISEALAGGSNVTMKLQWDGSIEQAGLVRANAVIQHYSGSSWSNQGTGAYTLAGADPYTLSVSNVSSFSPHKVADVANQVLPVELMTFSSECMTGYTQLNWMTASEINNDYFSIEASVDNEYFEEIGQVLGNGNSNTTSDYIYYVYNDEIPVYYRLTQYDFNGDYEIHDVIYSDCSGESNSSPELKALVNAEGGFIDINFTTAGSDFYKLSVVDASGRMVYYENDQADDDKQKRKVYIDGMSTGVYLISLYLKNTVYSVKLIVL